MYTPSRHFLDCHIAGFAYWDGLDVYENIKIGYIPQYKNSEINLFLCLGHTDVFQARVNAVNTIEHP